MQGALALACTSRNTRQHTNATGHSLRMPIRTWWHDTRQPVLTTLPLTRRDVLVGCLPSGLYLLYFLLIQPLITVNHGQGWDGRDYFMLASGNFTDPVYPLAQRIGMPLLAAHGPTSDLLSNFRIWNALLAFLHGVVTWLLIASVERRRLPWLRIAAWVMICASQSAPIPGAVWSPVQNDIAVALFSQLLLLLVLIGRCYGWLLFTLFFFGTLCRENFAQYAIFFIFRWDLVWDHTRSLLGNIVRFIKVNQQEGLRLLVPAALGYILATLLVNQLIEQSMTIAERYRFYVDGVQWHHMTDIALSIIGVLSPSLFIYYIHRISGLKWSTPLLPAQPIWIILAVFFVIGIGGGTNTERYWYWMVPFLVLQSMDLIMALYRDNRRAALWFCIVYTLFMQRTLLPIEPSGMAGCTPADIYFGSSTFVGHFAQECEPACLPLLEFFFGAMLPLATLLTLWSPRKKQRP